MYLRNASVLILINIIISRIKHFVMVFELMSKGCTVVTVRCCFEFRRHVLIAATVLFGGQVPKLRMNVSPPPSGTKHFTLKMEAARSSKTLVRGRVQKFPA